MGLRDTYEGSVGYIAMISFNNNMVESIEAIVKLLLLQLGNFRDMGITMERMVCIQSIPILRAVVISL